MDVVEILAVQVKVIEGRQSDQELRHTAVHAAIEADELFDRSLKPSHKKSPDEAM